MENMLIPISASSSPEREEETLPEPVGPFQTQRGGEVPLQARLGTCSPALDPNQQLLRRMLTSGEEPLLMVSQSPPPPPPPSLPPPSTSPAARRGSGNVRSD
ncbi:unnamed protein product [Pleuronectes platessa]|uniref:Uncharacterized protein n=1 Tax=Pleuronectes platessa TaxID=8262 RepID=A0A9N7VWE1_PLEPL|nr:unnamed protein product [Pleuronectes platessa]